MKISIVRSALPILAALALGACSSDAGDEEATETPVVTNEVPPAMGGAPALTPEQQQQQMAMFAELQAIDQQLAVVRDRALQDASMKAQEEELISVIEAAMEEVKPGSIELRADFETMITEYNAAREAGDQETVTELQPQLQVMDTELRETQTTVMQQPDMLAKVEEFQESLYAYMREIDDRADSLFTRGEELNVELQAMMSGADN